MTQYDYEDTGTILEVPEDQRLDADEGADNYALVGGEDLEGLEEIYENPDDETLGEREV